MTPAPKSATTDDRIGRLLEAAKAELDEVAPTDEMLAERLCDCGAKGLPNLSDTYWHSIICAYIKYLHARSAYLASCASQFWRDRQEMIVLAAKQHSEFLDERRRAEKAEAERDKLQAEKEIEFARGIVWALARVVDMHDEPTVAAEILREAQLDREQLQQCAEYDLKLLRKETRGLPKGID
jgi:hypothetical protein